MHGNTEEAQTQRYMKCKALKNAMITQPWKVIEPNAAHQDLFVHSVTSTGCLLSLWKCPSRSFGAEQFRKYHSL